MKIHNLDCVSFMEKMDSFSVDLVVTSPPYDNLRTYNGNNDHWNESVWKSVIKGLYRVVKDGGVVVWIVGDATIKGSETGTSFKQALWAMDCGFRLHDTMIWQKPGFSAIGALATRYAPVFEYMFILCKGKIKTFNPIKDRKNKVKGNISGTIMNTDGSYRRMSNEGKKRREYGQRFNIWQITQVNKNNVHPAMFPEQLAHDHIISWSNEGDTVFDPFMGSGTTGISCRNTGREFIGCEMDSEYFEIARNRLGGD